MYKLLILYILLLSVGTSVNIPFFGKEIQLADFFFIFVLASLLLDMKRGAGIGLFRPPRMIKYTLVIFLVLLLVACLFSVNSLKSLIEFSAMLYLVILYLWVAGINMDQPRLKSVLRLWLYLTGGLCILTLCGFISYRIFGNANLFIQIYPEMKSLIPFARLTATFPSINMFASFLHVGIVFLLALIIFDRWRLNYILLVILMFVCAFLTASRLLLGIFVTVFLALLPIRGRPSLIVFKYISLGLSLLFIFLVIMTTVWCVFPMKASYDRQDHAFSVSINTVPSLYSVLNRMSMRFIRHNLLTGIGPSMFNQMMIERFNWDEVKDTYKAKGFADRGVSLDPHSTYMGWGAEAGLLFAIVIIGLFYCISMFMWRGYRACGDSFSGWFSYVCLCGLIGFMINASYIDILTMRHFWVMLGLGTMAGLYCLEPRQS